ncbi:MAG: hypothetical protein ACYTGO_15340, partial [Planctomycetota bacterium]
MLRVLQPSFLALLVFVPTLDCQEPRSRPTTSRPSQWEKGLERAAAMLIASKKLQTWHRDYKGARYAGGTRLQHPLLEKYFPDRRFYFVELRIQHDKKRPRRLLHEYCLTILRAKDKAGTTYGRGQFNALKYLKASNVCART